MSVRLTPFVSGEYYHLYNRGNSKQVIFHDDQDHQYFMNLIGIMNNEMRAKSGVSKFTKLSAEALVSVGVYCLMTNHFHILLKQEKDNGITLFMQKMSTAYVMYYNKKYKRTGALFEGKFKSKYAGEDRYLKYLFAYIHLNPIKLIDENWKTSNFDKEKYKFLIEYPYSSFSEYSKGESLYTNKAAFPEYFPTVGDFTKEIHSWLKTNFS